MNRIDRDIQQAVFIPKGTWMVGGAVSYSEHDEGKLPQGSGDVDGG